MTAVTNDYERLANEILSSYKITEKPYKQISRVCKGEGIKIRSANLSEGVDGLFANIDEQKFIFYNSNKPRQRSVFTKAHELGHYFLQHTLDEKILTCSNIGNNAKGNSQEWQADQFAVYFLMPKALMVRHYAEICKLQNRMFGQPLYVDRQPWNYAEWKSTCAYFTMALGVSKEALRYRLEALNLLNWNLN